VITAKRRQLRRTTTPVTVAGIVVCLTICACPLVARVLSAHASAAVQDEEPIRALLSALEQALRSGDGAAYLALIADSADRRRAEDFAAAELRPGATRIVLKERSRTAIPVPGAGIGYRVMLDAFVESGNRARAARWRIELVKTADGIWRVRNQERFSGIENLYRLSMASTKQYDARGFTVRAEDLDLTLTDGSVFTVETDHGVTALVLLGRGTMRFQPAPHVERRQIKLFAGAETLESPFQEAFVRVGELDRHADLSQLTARPIDPRDLRRAEEVFREESVKSFAVDLGDAAQGGWSTLPPSDDVVAEIHTRRFGTLTYSRTEGAQEDISLIDRVKQKNISVYTSKDRLAARGRFYDDDALAEYDVLDYELDLAFDPVRRWFDARAQLTLRIQSPITSELTLRLAETLAVRSVTSDRFGGLFSARVNGQNTVLVILPVPVSRGTELTIALMYSGRVGPQSGDWETLLFTQRELDALAGTPDATTRGPRPETNYLYGNRSYWYPRATVFDYATARFRIWVPADFDCVAAGEPTPDSPTLDDSDPSQRRKRFVFVAERPIRYLSFLVTRMSQVDRATVAFSDEQLRGPTMGGAVYNTLNLSVRAHSAAVVKGRDVATAAAGIAQFYRMLVGDSPYSSLSLALVEGNAPGGHSPSYFAAVRRPSQGTPNVWRNDPASFDSYPEFLPAHEIAHQWWGQAVGWKTYHDQWLSEGFAQYFAALYTGHQHGDQAFRDVMRQMRRWAMDESEQGPLFLGYRIGHVRDDGRAFRAILYDKGAAVLHMLRRLVGDESFFLGIRRFYAGWRYEKASTEDLRHAMEAESGRSLERFFERWVYDSTLPQLKFSYRLQDDAGSGRPELVLRMDQTGELFDVPVTLLIEYSDRPATEVVMAVADRTTELRVPLAGSFRRVEISKEDGTLADVQR